MSQHSNTCLVHSLCNAGLSPHLLGFKAEMPCLPIFPIFTFFSHVIFIITLSIFQIFHISLLLQTYIKITFFIGWAIINFSQKSVKRPANGVYYYKISRVCGLVEWHYGQSFVIFLTCRLWIKGDTDTCQGEMSIVLFICMLYWNSFGYV